MARSVNLVVVANATLLFQLPSPTPIVCYCSYQIVDKCANARSPSAEMPNMLDTIPHLHSTEKVYEGDLVCSKTTDING